MFASLVVHILHGKFWTVPVMFFGFFHTKCGSCLDMGVYPEVGSCTWTHWWYAMCLDFWVLEFWGKTYHCPNERPMVMSFAYSERRHQHSLAYECSGFPVRILLRGLPRGKTCVGCLGQCWWWGRLMENSWVKTDQTSGKPSSWKLRHVKFILCEQWPAKFHSWPPKMIETLVGIHQKRPERLVHRCPFPIGWLINRGVWRTPFNNRFLWW